MNKKTTKAIVLKRIDYADSDRILTLLTPDFGKISVLAKGVRKINSKLAGGIELFAIFDAGFIEGRGQLGRLTSARLSEFYGDIMHDINRVQLGYLFLKTFDRYTEDDAEGDYFYLLCQLLRLLNDQTVPLTLLDMYFKSRLLLLAGHAPNLMTDDQNKSLKADESYDFSVLSMHFSPSSRGIINAGHIKLLRMLFSEREGHELFKVKVSGNEDKDLEPVVDAMFRAYLSV